MGSSYRYSQHARQSLALSHYWARQYGHETVDTDHLFLGILDTDGSLGWQVLCDLEFDRPQAFLEVQNLHSISETVEQQLPFSYELREALLMAVAEAQGLNSEYLGTEHILLGLIRSGNGQLRELLTLLDISPEQIRARCKRIIQQGISELTMESVRRMAKLSELAKRVLNAAKQIAAAHDQNTIAPEHVLLALTQERRSIAKRLLAQCNCDTEAISEAVIDLPAQSIELETRLNHILDRAVDRAEAMGSHYTGTEHILFAMTLLPWSQHMLQVFNVDVVMLQSLVYEALAS
ncbi:MAG: hypothetical protein H6673_07255 [Anaerolineales bacterium]|nr:hypothetical protein [Anaerolineales bacterium]